MRYGSVCSGIEAATVAWHPLGWEAAWFSEIEPFPCAVLKHHYPAVPNHGDMTNFQEWPNEPIDLLVGGTPCQSFSVAGLRKGLADPRGNLMLTFGAIARRYRPEWLVWENVPGVLSSNGGRDFGTFLGMLAELGYGFAYRILDAQYFGVAQRRRRVFVVANARGWHRAAAVLFERHSLSGNPPSRGEARQVSASGVGGGPEGGSISGAVTCKWAKGSGGPAGECYNMVAQPIGLDEEQNAVVDGFGTLKARTEGGGFEGCVAQPVATFAKTHKPMSSTDPEGWSPVDAAPTVTHWPRDRSDAGTDVAVVQPVTTFAKTHKPIGLDEEQNACVDGFGTLKARMEGGGFEGSVMTPAMQVRRLTPVECERLQGFPDGYTNIPWRKKPESPDGPRYKALGNSMAVPVMRWIGQRIKQVSEL